MNCMIGRIEHNLYFVQHRYSKDMNLHIHQDMKKSHQHIPCIDLHWCIMNNLMDILNMQSLMIDKIQVSMMPNIDLWSHILDSNHNMRHCTKIVPVGTMYSILLIPCKLHRQNHKIHTNHSRHKFLVHSLLGIFHLIGLHLLRNLYKCLDGLNMFYMESCKEHTYLKIVQ